MPTCEPSSIDSVQQQLCKRRSITCGKRRSASRMRIPTRCDRLQTTPDHRRMVTPFAQACSYPEGRRASTFTSDPTMSTEPESPANAPRGSLRLAPNVDELEEHKRKLPRQFVNFIFYRARPEWRMLDDTEKSHCKQRFIDTVDDFRRDLLINTYSTVGWRTNADFMIWRIGYNLEPIQEMTSLLNGTPMAKYLDAMQSLVSLTKRSTQVKKECSAHNEARTDIT